MTWPRRSPTRSSKSDALGWPRILLVAWLATAAGCSTGDESAEVPAATPGLEASGEDYATARSRFRTRLVREGPASLGSGGFATPFDAIEAPYRSAGLDLRALASRPEAGGKRKPAVLFLHGGFAMGEGHWAMTRPFREAGYVVMVPTLRGENGQPGTSTLFFDEVEDVLAAGGSLAGRADADPDRVYVAGHSVGGTLALLAALIPGRFRAAASFSGSPDQVQYTRGRPELIPFDPAERAEFRIRSPVAFATGFRCPVRLYFGEEELWLQDATRRTAHLAKRAGLDIQCVGVVGGHDTANPEVIEACIAFFRTR